MDNYDPVKAIRMHWTEIIEEALECPVCFEIPVETYIYICVNGHDICKTCRKMMSGPNIESCPICKGSFSGTRNRCMEELAKKFDEMKTSLLDPNSIRQMRKVEKKTIETQTDALIAVKLENDLETKNVSTQTASTDAFSSGIRTPRRSTRTRNLSQRT